MKLAIEVLEEKIQSLTGGFHVGKIIEKDGEILYVKYRGKMVFGHIENGDANIGDIYVALETDELPSKCVPNPNSTFKYKAVELENKLFGVSMEQVNHLLKALDRLYEEKLETKTPMGSLIAVKSTDPNYPGIFVDVVGDDGFADSAALIEYVETEGIVVRAWRKDEDEPVYGLNWSQD